MTSLGLSLTDGASLSRTLPAPLPPAWISHFWNEPSLTLPPRVTPPAPRCGGDTGAHAGRHPRPPLHGGSHPSPHCTQRPCCALAHHCPCPLPLTPPHPRGLEQRLKQKTCDRTPEVCLGRAGPTAQRSRDAVGLRSITAQGFPPTPSTGLNDSLSTAKRETQLPLGPSMEGTRKNQHEISFQIINKNREALRFQQKAQHPEKPQHKTSRSTFSCTAEQCENSPGAEMERERETSVSGRLHPRATCRAARQVVMAMHLPQLCL